MSRASEIAQGLRNENGSLTFALDAIDYVRGMDDYVAGNPPPKMSSPSYDLGRAREQQKAERKSTVLDQLRRDQAEGRRRTRIILADHPDILAKYEADISGV